jgi:hypothetical protein
MIVRRKPVASELGEFPKIQHLIRRPPRKQMEIVMTQMNLKTVVIATSTFACAALLSVNWSEQRGVSLSVESAQARVGRPLTPVSVAGVARRQNRRAAYGYDAAGISGPMAADYAGIAAASAGPAPAPAAPAWNLYTAYRDNGPFYGYSGWSDYKARGGIGCDPGTVYRTENGVHYICQ